MGAVRHFLKEEPTCVNKNDYTSSGEDCGVEGVGMESCECPKSWW